jgi:hypothetical protein
LQLASFLLGHETSKLSAIRLRVRIQTGQLHCVQVIAQMELWKEKASGRYEKMVYILPKHLDEKVAALHLRKLGAKLTKLSKDQSAYINVPVEGPFKPAHYRY